ncbi:hypothetical protein ARMGADRAFT_1091659 [Armillaria gallica]|uniref:Uncharacterized protein n=1 Tax=Armillaria gallica TaxID=47427 RepID=A0A2H3CDI0_ARMGA|nr:hypothetical protein ARMGADRAFT_1091659 [Armillaria gallica]
MSSQPPKVILGETLGALYVGATIAAVWAPFLARQNDFLFNCCDWWVYRYSVALLWILDTLHVVLTTHAMYFYLVDMSGDLAGALVHIMMQELQGDLPILPTINLSNGSFLTQVQLDINALIVVYVQGLYAIRIWKRSCLYALAIVIDKASDTPIVVLPLTIEQFLAVAASLGAGIFVTYDISITRNFSNIAPIKTSIYTIFATIAATDFVIALMMCYYLHKSRVATKFSSTASLLLNLMRIIIVSGLATR